MFSSIVLDREIVIDMEDDTVRKVKLATRENRLVEQTEAHILVRSLLLFLFLGSGSWGSVTAS